jgi:hypothetical protein
MSEFEVPDNVVYIDEFKRERWLHRLRVSREMAKLVTPTPEQQFGRNVVPFPEERDEEGDGIA